MRVNLGHVQAALGVLDTIKEAVAVQEREGGGQETILVAFVLPSSI
jgi:hypothetical protein